MAVGGEATLVTGATGTVGWAIVQRLVEDGVAVRALVRDVGRARALLPPAVEPVHGDVTDAASVQRAVGGCVAVYHAAGLPEQWLPDPATFVRVNVDGTRHMVESALAAGVGAFVYTSTIDVFAWTPGGAFDESTIDPHPKATPYERSKQVADRLVTAALDRGLPARFLHPSAVYGPAAAVNPGLNELLLKLARSELPMLLPGGMPVVFADDVAAAHVRAAAAPVGSRFILSESVQPLVAIAEAVVAAHGRGRVPRVMPDWVAGLVSAIGEAIAGVVRRPPLIPRGQLQFLRLGIRPDATRARTRLGWQPTPFADGVRRTLAAFEARGLC